MRDLKRSVSDRIYSVAAATVLVFSIGARLTAQDAAAPAAASPQTGAQVTTPIPGPTGPPSVGLGGQLADWLQIRGEFRGRFEGFTGGAFRPDNGDAYMLDRFRVNATMTPGAMAKFVVQMQDARVLDKTSGGRPRRFATRSICDWRMAISAGRAPSSAWAVRSWCLASSGSSVI